MLVTKTKVNRQVTNCLERIAEMSIKTATLEPSLKYPVGLQEEESPRVPRRK